jgi:hypothetical protein
MIARPRIGFLIFFVALFTASTALGFEDSLSSTSIRDAYILGNRKDFKTSEFFARYKHDLPMPDSGPHVATISVETPYGQVVELGEAAMNIDIQGTEQQLADKTFPFIVRVGVDLTDDYPGPPPSNPFAVGVPIPDFERDFGIQLVQGKKVIPVKSTQVYLLTSDAVANIYQISGAIIELKYDTAALDPDDEATVKVHTPDDQNVETTFDLRQLR